MLERSEASKPQGKRVPSLHSGWQGIECYKNLLRTIFITIISRSYDSLAVIYPVQEKRKECIPGCEEDAR